MIRGRGEMEDDTRVGGMEDDTRQGRDGRR